MDHLIDDSDRLKPCPFCGGAAEMHQAHDPDGPNDQGYYVECGKCGASTNLRFSCGEDARPLLMEQWNRRSTIASLERQLEDAKARAESAERALAEARKDQGRMDWLAARPREATIRIGADMKPCTFWGISSSRTDMRAAIDSAIEAEKGARNVRD